MKATSSSSAPVGESQDYVLPVDDEPDLAFHGRLIASVKSSPVATAEDYSRSEGRWMELSLYETQRGTIIAYEVKRSKIPGERDRTRAEAFAPKLHDDPDKTRQRVRIFFGQGWLAKKLYAKAGIENVLRVA